MAITYKNKVDKLMSTVETVEKQLNEISNYLSKEAKYGGKEEVERSEKFNNAIEEGKEAGRRLAIEKIRDAINNDPSKFIRSIKDLQLDSSSSYVKDVDHERHQLLNKSSVEQIKTPVAVARKFGAKDIYEQWLTFIGKIDYSKTKTAAQDAEAVRLLLEYVGKPALEKGSIAPADAKEILQNALDKLTPPEGQTQVGAQDNNQEQIQKQTQGSEEKKEENNEQILAIKEFAGEATASELLAEMRKREASIEKFITGIEKADPKLLQKANAAILQFSAELQAILNKVDLSDKEKEQLQEQLERLNSAVEAKAKELNVGTKTLTVSDKHLKATEEHIENLMKRKEEEYEEVITKYHDFVVKIFAEEFNIPEESIDETLEERISRHTELGRALRNRSKGESESPKTAEGFDINSVNQNNQ